MSRQVETTVFAALDQRLDRTARAPLAVAVSGGGDSLALMRLAAGWAARVGRPLQVLTVDHELQAASSDWARFVGARSAELGLPCRTLRWVGPKPATGLPAAAREVRHALLAEAAREAGARVILLGHTVDDIAESEWMRSERSTLGRLRDWSPSPAWPEGRGLMLLRPLLTQSRAELRAWLTGQGLNWLEDPANADLRYARPRARAALAGGATGPQRPPTTETFPHEPDLARSSPATPGALTIERARLSDAGRAEAILGAALLCASGGIRPPRTTALARLMERLRNGEAFTATLAGAKVEAGATQLVLGRDPGRRGCPRLTVEGGRTVVWDGRFEIMPELDGVVGPAAGRLARLSRANRAAIAGAPAWLRGSLPVLETPDGAVRLPAVRALAAERLRLALNPPSTEQGLTSQG